jgi:TolB protein
MNDHDELADEIRARTESLHVEAPSPAHAMSRGRRRRRVSRLVAAAAALVIALGVALPLRALMRLGEASREPIGPSPSSSVITPAPTGAIAFIDGGQAFGPITLLDVASGSMARLTKQSFSSVSLAWSPDGSLIAVTRSVLEGNGELVLVSTETGEIVRTMPIDTGLHPQDVAWSPDGRSLAFSDTYQRLHMIDVDGSNLRSIPTDDSRALGIEFSPSGTEIAFIGDKGDLRVVSLASAETRLLVTDRGIRYSPAWSPDGARIAYATNGPEGMSINVVDADGSNETMLVDDSVYAVNPSWSPDGNWISFERISDERKDLFAVSVSDGSLRQLTDTASGEVGSDWGLLPADVAPSSPASTPGSTTGPNPSDDTITDYQSFLDALRPEVKLYERGGPGLQRLVGVPGHRFYAGGALYVHEFPSAAALDEFRQGVSPDGSMLPTRDGDGSIIVEWAAPRLYAEGRVLVIYFGESEPMLATLRSVVGRPFAPTE